MCGEIVLKRRYTDGKSLAVRSPTEAVWVGNFQCQLARLYGERDTIQGVVRSPIVVVILESHQLPLEVAKSPKGHLVEILPPDRPDESFHERVRDRYVGHGLNLRHIDDL